MSKLKKLKDIDNYKPRVESVYESVKNNREQALEVARNCDPKLKEVTKFDLKR